MAGLNDAQDLLDASAGVSSTRILLDEAREEIKNIDMPPTKKKKLVAQLGAAGKALEVRRR